MSGTLTVCIHNQLSVHLFPADITENRFHGAWRRLGLGVLILSPCLQSITMIATVEMDFRIRLAIEVHIAQFAVGRIFPGEEIWISHRCVGFYRWGLLVASCWCRWLIFGHGLSVCKMKNATRFGLLWENFDFFPEWHKYRVWQRCCCSPCTGWSRTPFSRRIDWIDVWRWRYKRLSCWSICREWVLIKVEAKNDCSFTWV